MKLFAYKSKRTGRFFKFVEYCDDGFGKYHDDISFPFKDGMPSFFNGDKLNNPKVVLSEFYDHKKTGIEAVEFELNIKE